ncbi:fimbrial biogenesis chaperone [Huaxiibacter chinensis]
MHFYKYVLCITAISAVLFSTAHAGVIIGGTRVIFEGNKKEASLSINNPDNAPFLIQSWIETASGGQENVPFIITPPLYRLDKGQQNVERIVMTEALAQNKESLFWLNIKAIPSASQKENTLQIAVKTRIKLIYRPAALAGSLPEEDADKLTWKVSGNHLQVFNPGRFVMNFNEVRIGHNKVDDATYVLPGATALFNLPAGNPRGSLSFKLINDFGSTGAEHRASL